MSEFDQFLSCTEGFVQQDVAKAVKILEDIPGSDAAIMLRKLSAKSAQQIINRLQSSFAAQILACCDCEKIREYLKVLPPNKAAAVVVHLPLSMRDNLLFKISGKFAESKKSSPAILREMLVDSYHRNSSPLIGMKKQEM